MSLFIDSDESIVLITCKCGCQSALQIQIDPDDENAYSFLSYMNGNFYRDQYGAFGVIKEKVRRIWAIVRNKDYYYSDIKMTKEDFNKFVDYLSLFRGGKCDNN